MVTSIPIYLEVFVFVAISTDGVSIQLINEGRGEKKNSWKLTKKKLIIEGYFWTNMNIYFINIII